MATKEKVCKNCKIFVSDSKCPVCGESNFSRSWKGLMFINDPQTSEVAQLLGIKAPGKYAMWVR